jgi:hypothetical protein
LGLVGDFITLVRRAVGLPDKPGTPPVVKHLALCWAQVLQQHADGSLDLQPVDTNFPGEKNVAMSLPFPGAVVQVQTGALVILAWASGDPKQKFVLPVWGVGSTLISAAIGSSPDSVITKQDLTALINAIKNATYTLATGPGVTGGTSTPLVFSPPANYGSNAFSVQR